MRRPEYPAAGGLQTAPTCVGGAGRVVTHRPMSSPGVQRQMRQQRAAAPGGTRFGQLEEQVEGLGASLAAELNPVVDRLSARPAS
jgi:hypothetical protein